MDTTTTVRFRDVPPIGIETFIHLRDSGPRWMGLAIGTSDTDAKAKFRTLYNSEPEQVKTTGGGVLVGPIPQLAENEV